MKLNVRTGDTIILAGEFKKISQISELTAAEKMKLNISPSFTVRRLTLDDKQDILFVG
jgi:hypothetical protein